MKMIHTLNMSAFVRELSKVAFTALFVLLSLSVSHATHIVGGNMYYRCLGNDMYEITMTIRRDCINGADDAKHDGPQVYLTIFDGQGGFFPRRGDNGFIVLDLLGIDTLNNDLSDFCIDGGDTVCVSQAVYRGMACLPYEKTGYIISYQRCCRNGSLNNIEMPLETGGTWMVEITPQAQEECNSNPVFNSWPPIYVCQNQPLSYDHSATDPDGDSLVYKLCSPLQGATIGEPAPSKSSSPPFDSVVWASPYGVSDMMGGIPLSIDPQTGEITATPDMEGQFLIGVMVEEYRNGVLIGRNKRDFEFNVRACGDKPEADFEVLTDRCDGLMQMFRNTSVGASKYTWYFDYPNLTPTSMEVDPKHTYDSAGVYTVVLIAENDAGCKDTASQVIEVLNPMIVPDFEVEVDCEDTLKITIINLTTAKDTIDNFMWEVIGPGGTQVSMEREPMFFFPDTGKVIIRLKVTDINGCIGEIEKMIRLQDVTLEFIQDSFCICVGDEIRLIRNGNPDWTYMWSPTDSLKLDPPYDPRACPTRSITYCVTVTDGNCSTDGCVYVEVVDTIPVDIMGPDSTCNGDVMLMALTDTANIIEWSNHPSFDTIIGTGDKLNYTIHSTTTFYVRVGGDSIKCPGLDSHKVVYFDAIIEDIEPIKTICFGPGMIHLNPGGNEDYIYSWSPGKYLDDSTAANPKAMIDSTTTFTVIIINPKYPECPDTIDVLVQVGLDFAITDFPIDTLICDGDSVLLTVSVTHSGLEIVWCDDMGNVIGRGDSIWVDPSLYDFVVVKVSDFPECVRMDTMRIDFYDLDVTINAPDSICLGDTVMIMLTNNGSDSLMVEWFPKDDIIGPDTGFVIKVYPTETTTYTAVISNKFGCEWERTITVGVGGFDIPIIATEDPDTINPGDTTMLDVNIEDAVSYMWTGIGLDDPNIKSPKAVLNDPGSYTYIIKVTDEMGCMGTDTVTVFVRDPNCEEGVFLPNAFSPNGDGENDRLEVLSPFVQDMELFIYNRWGELVFSTNNQSFGWDGTFKGQTLSPDVYGYLLRFTCVDGRDYVRKGNVTLLK